MTPLLFIKPRTAHFWIIELPQFISAEPSLFTLLSPDEVSRAERFHFPLHRQRFVIARSLLRKTLSLYIDSAPEEIEFTYGPHGKPYLKENKYNLQFNLSHSADLAIIALTTQQEIGVDIEKIESSFNIEVAKRFFSAAEYAQLMELSPGDRANGFYQIWAKKEAIIKVLGEGLFTPLTEFSVSLGGIQETVVVKHPTGEQCYQIGSLQVSANYAAAFASLETVEEVVYKKC